jgi:hypothetical protein
MGGTSGKPTLDEDAVMKIPVNDAAVERMIIIHREKDSVAWVMEDVEASDNFDQLRRAILNTMGQPSHVAIDKLHITEIVTATAVYDVSVAIDPAKAVMQAIRSPQNHFVKLTVRVGDEPDIPASVEPRPPLLLGAALAARRSVLAEKRKASAERELSPHTKALITEIERLIEGAGTRTEVGLVIAYNPSKDAFLANEDVMRIFGEERKFKIEFVVKELPGGKNYSFGYIVSWKHLIEEEIASQKRDPVPEEAIYVAVK